MKKLTLFFLVLIICGFVFPIIASADMGPKPSLDIVVKNAPKQKYYLDLLVNYTSTGLFKNTYDTPYSQEMLNILKNYKTDGWHPALVMGSEGPLFGELTGVKSGSNMVHNFDYIGVPDRFKIIIVTQDNKTIVSKNVIDKKAFQSTVYFDVKTQDAYESPFILAYLLQFIFTCTCTLIIEGLVLLLFQFSLKQNWKPFVSINVFTQILLTLVIFGTMYTAGSLAAILFYIPFELVIVIIEAILFAKYLTQYSKRRRVLFAITANFVSFILGFIALVYIPFQ